MTEWEAKRRWPNASAAFIRANVTTQTNPELPDTKPAQQTAALDGHRPREAQGAGRPIVRFVLVRTRLLDTDAKWGSVKDVLDGLAYAGLIPGDREDQICLEVAQRKATKGEEERTEIEITYP